MNEWWVPALIGPDAFRPLTGPVCPYDVVIEKFT
jgi:hypothetical protein